MNLRRWASIVALCLVLPEARAAAGEHLVPASEVSRAVAAASLQRSADLGRLQGSLASPAARRAAERLGVDANDLAAGLSSLSDGELRDLAARASALDTDPAAGLRGDVNDLLVIFLIVALVILLLKAV